MRFLCLHGMGTNSEVFELQSAALRQELGGSQHTFEFLEGSLSWPAAPRIEELFPSSEGYFAFYDPESAPTVLSALDDLDEYVAKEGPFDGVMGFSQGAALAAMLMIRHYSSTNGKGEGPFRFAIFICAAVPHREIALRRGIVEFLDPVVDSQPIKVPTTNIVGARDPHIANAMTLSNLCQDRGKAVFDHGGGHEIPRHPKEITSEMAQAILDTIQKAFFVQ